MKTWWLRADSRQIDDDDVTAGAVVVGLVAGLAAGLVVERPRAPGARVAGDRKAERLRFPSSSTVGGLGMPAHHACDHSRATEKARKLPTATHAM